MDIVEVLTHLADGRAVLRIPADGNQPTLRITMETVHWTAPLREQVRLQKPALLRLLACARGGPIPAETLLGWQEWYEERAAIAEYEGGLPRDRAEHAAWNALRAHIQEASSPPS